MGSSSKSSNQTSTKYQTQNISSPGAQNVAGGNVTINATAKPALDVANNSVSKAMEVSEKAISGVTGFAGDALGANVAIANKSMDKISDAVDLSYRQTTNQQQQLKDMTQTAMADIAAASRPDSSLNSALLIKTAGIVGGLAVIIIIFKKK